MSEEPLYNAADYIARFEADPELRARTVLYFMRIIPECSGIIALLNEEKEFQPYEKKYSSDHSFVKEKRRKLDNARKDNSWEGQWCLAFRDAILHDDPEGWVDEIGLCDEELIEGVFWLNKISPDISNYLVKYAFAPDIWQGKEEEVLSIIEQLPSNMQAQFQAERLILFQNMTANDRPQPFGSWQARVSANDDRAPTQAASAAIGGG